jgi:hypothetical protein
VIVAAIAKDRGVKVMQSVAAGLVCLDGWEKESREPARLRRFTPLRHKALPGGQRLEMVRGYRL